MGFLEEAVVFEETGRALYPGPVFSTLALARPALAGSELLAPVLGGQATATLAWAEDGALGLLDSPGVRADAAGRLTGTKRYVPDLGLADVAVVVADAGLYAVNLREAGRRGGAQVHAGPHPSARRPCPGRHPRHASARRPGRARRDPAAVDGGAGV